MSTDAGTAGGTDIKRSSTGPASIKVRGVRVHNLKNVDVDIPRGQLVAFCGVSGSGKTSLALDTLYAEGQRRYIESFSAYTRQYLERLEKPDYDSIEGLPPALAVTRESAPRGNRSTVGTASETLDYLRLLFANSASLLCHGCGNRILTHSTSTIARLIHSLPPDVKLMLTFDASWESIEDRAVVLADLQSAGFVRLISGEKLYNLGQDDRQQLAQGLPNSGSAQIVVDRLKGAAAPERTTESLEHAFEHGYGQIGLLVEGLPQTLRIEVANETCPSESELRALATELTLEGQSWSYLPFTTQRYCRSCDIEYPTPEPRLFSFNSPLGACSLCEGFGDTIDLDPQLIVPDPSKSIREGAIAPWSSPAYEHNLDELLDIADELRIRVDVPYRKLRPREIKVLFEGSEKLGYEGIQGFFAWLERKKYKMHVRVFLSRWRSYNRCTSCHGARLSPEALAFKIDGKSIAELCELQVSDLSELLSSIEFSSSRDRAVAEGPIQQVLDRLGYLDAVGLGYLQLSRTLRTLSGGEAQRTALTATLGSSLVNMLYVLDEPSVGLHPFDVQKLSQAVRKLTARGNTVIVVEHEELLLEQAETIVEVGPQAGNRGGQIVYCGSTPGLLKEKTLTSDYLAGRRQVPIPGRRRTAKKHIDLKGCTGNNLKAIDVHFPLEVLCLVTGISGSGKSTLVQDTLYGALKNRLSTAHFDTLPFDAITGTGQIDDCILVDQSPVSRSPRSNPVTYIKAFDEIRSAFAETLEAKTRNLSAGHFSFNSELGRCTECNGDGVQQIDMLFLADVQMTCQACRGTRYRKEILSIRYRDQSIADVLNMTVHEAMHFFRGAPRVQQKLKVLADVGLDYLQLGQSAMTLSSGEAQRLKLAGHLASASRKRTLFILDEPTTGLHPHDIVQLLDCFDALLAAGHSLIVVEHNLHLMAAADYLIDLGPGPAELGGKLVAEGTPEEIAQASGSTTGEFLGQLFASRP